MRYALHAEWTKLRTAPGTLPLLLAVVAATVALSAGADTCSPPVCGADLPRLSLTGVQLGQAIVAILAILVMGNEIGTGMLAVTLAAVPRRGRVVAAKAVVVSGVTAVAGALGVAGALAVGRLLLPPHDLVLRPAAGSVLYLVLVGLLSLGVVTAVRNAAAATGVVLALLYALPVVTAVVSDPDWHRRLERLGPVDAGLAVQSTTGDAAIGPWQGLGVLALWTLGVLAAGTAVLARHDAGTR